MKLAFIKSIAQMFVYRFSTAVSIIGTINTLYLKSTSMMDDAGEEPAGSNPTTSYSSDHH